MNEDKKKYSNAVPLLVLLACLAFLLVFFIFRADPSKDGQSLPAMTTEDKYESPTREILEDDSFLTEIMQDHEPSKMIWQNHCEAPKAMKLSDIPSPAQLTELQSEFETDANCVWIDRNCPEGLICGEPFWDFNSGISSSGELVPVCVQCGPDTRITEEGDTLANIAERWNDGSENWHKMCIEGYEYPEILELDPNDLLSVGTHIWFC